MWKLKNFAEDRNKEENALDIYQNHTEHKKVSEFIGKVREERIVIDYLVESRVLSE